MVDITLRSSKSSGLTTPEMDNNLKNLSDGVDESLSAISGLNTEVNSKLKIDDYQQYLDVPFELDTLNEPSGEYWFPVLFERGSKYGDDNRRFHYSITAIYEIGVPNETVRDSSTFSPINTSEGIVEIEFFYGGDESLDTFSSDNFERFRLVIQKPQPYVKSIEGANAIVRGNGALIDEYPGAIVYLRSGRYLIRSLAGTMGGIRLADEILFGDRKGGGLSVSGENPLPFDVSEAHPTLIPS